MSFLQQLFLNLWVKTIWGQMTLSQRQPKTIRNTGVYIMIPNDRNYSYKVAVKTIFMVGITIRHFIKESQHQEACETLLYRKWTTILIILSSSHIGHFHPQNGQSCIQSCSLSYTEYRELVHHVGQLFSPLLFLSMFCCMTVKAGVVFMP